MFLIEKWFATWNLNSTGFFGSAYTVCRKFDSLYKNSAFFHAFVLFVKIIWTLLGVKKERLNNSFKIQNASNFLNSRTNAVNGT